MKYIQSDKNKDVCIFCQALSQADGPENLVVYRGEHAFIILNRFPYTSGHIMVVPYQHRPSLEDLDSDTRGEMMELASRSLLALREVYRPQGFNVGVNIGEAAGAGVTDHVHMHVVPRWGGDTNFMSSVGGARVLPESLEETHERIRLAWEGLVR